jgi:hypothetical protein
MIVRPAAKKVTLQEYRDRKYIGKCVSVKIDNIGSHRNSGTTFYLPEKEGA